MEKIFLYGLFAWHIGLGGLTFYRGLTGGISAHGLLREKAEAPIAPERAQLLLVSIASIAFYGVTALKQPYAAASA